MGRVPTCPRHQCVRLSFTDQRFLELGVSGLGCMCVWPGLVASQDVAGVAQLLVLVWLMKNLKRRTPRLSLEDPQQMSPSKPMAHFQAYPLSPFGPVLLVVFIFSGFTAVSCTTFIRQLYLTVSEEQQSPTRRPALGCAYLRQHRGAACPVC